ncbi:MAG TPA: protein translocase subunit SecD [Acidimicrobiales bacterium]|nr:protein translocase subunit SecD [Acidimicrobiales bacterium]
MRERPLVISLVVCVAVAIVAFGATMAGRWAPKLGLDLAGGAEVIYQPAHKVSSGNLSTAVDIMRNRVDAAGVAGANIGTQGSDIVVQLPGVKNANSLIKTIGTTAEMLFRPVLCYAPPYTAPKSGSPPTTPPPNCSSSQYDLTAANLNVNTSTGQPSSSVGADPTLASYPNSSADYDDSHLNGTVILPASAGSGQAGTRFLLGPVGLAGSQVASAQAALGSSGTGWVVNLTLKGAGSSAWDRLADQQFHAYIAIDLDGQVISAPLTQPSQATFSSFGGKVQISGNFTQSSAQTLALDLNYGALPVRLEKLTQENVSATLGKSSLKAGLFAGLGGLALVLLYMILYYRGLGVVVVLGLITTSLLLWAIVSALSHSGLDLTLDLSGVTGVIVSIGITADSYVIYFERLKDQARAGRSLRSTVEKSFAGAFRTVLAADLVSLIGAAVLWLLAVGDVRGFAFFLGLSTLMNIIITYFFTRPLVVLLGRSHLAEMRFLGLTRGLAAEGTA